MCVASMIYDHFNDKWQQTAPAWLPCWGEAVRISPAEIDEFRKLLERAREYDKKHNQPDCELEEKQKKLKELAKKLGIEVPVGV